MAERFKHYRAIMQEANFSTIKELAKFLGKDETYVGRIFKIDKLDVRITRDVIEKNTIEDATIIYFIAKLGKVDSDGYNNKQYNAYLHIIKENLGRAKVEEYINSLLEKEPAKKKIEIKATKTDVNISLKIPKNNVKIDKHIKEHLNNFLEPLDNLTQIAFKFENERKKLKKGETLSYYEFLKKELDSLILARGDVFVEGEKK